MSTDQLRSRIKTCMVALDPTKPIVFGDNPLIKDYLPEDFYVKGLHGGNKDLVRGLADQIDFDEGGGTYLFSGNRGTGKTSEMMRLAQLLQNQGCEVFYINMAEYLNLTMSIEVTDFLISVLGGLSEQLEERYGANHITNFFERTWGFLQSEVNIEGLDLETGIGDNKLALKLALRENPNFKKSLQEGMRGHVARFMQDARAFAQDAVKQTQQSTSENTKIVLLIDSLEQLRGVGGTADVSEVFKSAETLFSGHADKLRFDQLHIVYTIPPYLSALAGNLAALYSGGKIYMLPSVHIYERCPTDGNRPIASGDGLKSMVQVLEKRYSDWQEFFTEAQLERLAASSGGDLRDFFRMIKLCLPEAQYVEPLPLPDSVIESAENDVRRDMPLADDDKAWLAKIQKSHQRELPSLDRVADFARLVEGKYVLNYRNGEDWFDVHPLLRNVIADLA